MTKEKKILSEDGFDIGMDYDGGGFGSVGGGNLDDMFATFIQPFTDVAQTAIAGGLDIGNHALGLLKIVGAGIFASVLPFVEVEYDKIHAKTKERTKKIQSKFSNVFARTEKTLQDSHFKTLLFLVNPGAAMAHTTKTLTKKIAGATKEKTKDMYTDLKNTFEDTTSELTRLFQQQGGLPKSESIKNQNNIITEKSSNVGIEKTINDTEMAQEMKKEAIIITKERLEGYFNAIKHVEKQADLKGLQNILGFETKLLSQHADVKDVEERDELEDQLLDDTLDQVKNAILGKLEEEKKSFDSIKFDISDITNLYNQAINTIKNI